LPKAAARASIRGDPTSRSTQSLQIAPLGRRKFWGWDLEIIAVSGDRLGHYQCPHTIEFGLLPKTSTRNQKLVLREREWKGH
jgi:hypothetical protein